MLKLKTLFEQIKGFILKNPKLSALIFVFITALYIFITIEALHFSSAPNFCQKCHPEQGSGPLSEVYTWSKNIHAQAKVECLDCHGAPGFVGYMKAKMGGLYDVYGEFMKPKEHKLAVLKKASDPAYAAKLVPNDRCLFCHSDSYNQKIRAHTWMTIGVKMRTLDGVKNPDFRMSKNMIDVLNDPVRTEVDPKHRTHLDNGINCLDCHLGVAHAGEFKNLTKMQTCFDCHDKARTPKMPANEDCMACHSNPQKVLPKGDFVFNKSSSPVNFNHSSHAVIAKCTDCHSKIFPAKKQATTVTFINHTNGTLCFSCHNGTQASAWSADCTKCHIKPVYPANPIKYTVQGMSPAYFSHQLHAKMFSCDDCHNSIWQMQAKSKKMTMQEMYEGKYCGRCHNAQIAFASTDCMKCHK